MSRRNYGNRAALLDEPRIIEESLCEEEATMNAITTEFFPTKYWHALDDGRVQCDVCPRFCKLHEGQRGLCFVRGNQDDAIVLTTWGRSSGFCIDPIEKKPLNHFLPGTPVLSFGTAGCNLACKFCQNWDMSKSREMDTLADAASPETLARVGARTGLPQRGLHLQRPGHLHGVRDRRRRRLPGATASSRWRSPPVTCAPNRAGNFTATWTPPTST
jgi:hypothetical protein